MSFYSQSIARPVATVVAATTLVASSLSSRSSHDMAAHGTSHSALQAQSVDSLMWMAGCWEQATARSVTREHWSRPAGGAMMGVNFTVRKTGSGDAAGAYEFLRIHQKGGTVVYTALPSGQALTDFPLKSMSAGSVTFENPTHDFPQRIIYTKRGTDSLVARVEGMQDGKLNGFNIGLRKVGCP